GIAVPTLVSTLAISCVFTSVVFLEGPAKYLFTPLGLAVVFAMLASYGLSRTLTPITIGLLLKGEGHGTEGGWFARFHHHLERGFDRLREGYAELLATLLTRRIIVPIIAGAILALGTVMYLFVGRDFFPIIDGGQIQLHVRAPAGTRIEKTEQIFEAVENKIRDIIPASERELIVDNIALPAAFPEDIFYFQAADMVTQILNFGVTAQIDVRTVGYDRVKNLHIARQLRRRIGAIPGVADTHLQQEVNAPAFFAAIDRTRAAELGLNASQIATNLNVSLSSSEQVTPNFWTDLSKGIPYYLVVQTPEPQVASLNALTNTPVSTALSPQGDPVPGLLSNVATLTRIALPTNANQANIQPIYEVYANLQGRDLGSVAGEIGKVVAGLQKDLSPGNTIQVLGQIGSMNDAFRDMGIGLLFAAVFVYLLMVVNYQN